MNDLLAALRVHIVAIAACATLVFGHLFVGSYPVGLALLVGFDWCIVNLMNRATDVDEDRLNGIAATELVARHARAIVASCLAALVASLALGAALLPPRLAALRVAFHALGLGYSFRLVPTPKGRRRFKDIYALKNGVSAFMFVLSVGLYPVLEAEGLVTLSAGGVAAVLLFFFLFEQSFEVIYDLRDVVGDSRVGVPTYPVVHGVRASAGVVVGLCLASAAVLAVGRALHAVTTRELLMAAAPALQIAFLRARGAENVTRRDCVGITYAGAALLLVYLAGTAAWARAGLPMDL